MTDSLEHLIVDWPGEPALAVADRTHILGSAGPFDRPMPLASVTKLFTAYAALIAIEEGTIALDDLAGPPESTVRHLLSHTSGLRFDDRKTLALPGQRRIYSNAGIEMLAEHIAERAAMDFAEYLQVGVLDPLGIETALTGSPAHGMRASLADLVRFGREVLGPTLVSAETVRAATTPVLADVRGVLPGFGSYKANLWGLGFEIRGNKHPHWTGPNQSPATFGHFGGTGSFLWIDPDEELIGVSLSNEGFRPWALTAWPAANAELFDRYRR